MAMKSGNPALSSKTFDGLEASDEPMTLAGTINKAAMLLAVVLISSGWVWSIYFTAEHSREVVLYVGVGAIGGALVALLTISFKRISPYSSVPYAALEGLAIGGLSAVFEDKYPGIVIQSVGLTFGIFVCMLVAYRTEIIKVTENFKMGIVAATGGIAMLYLVDLALIFFGKPIGFVHEGGVLGIGFSLFVVAIAALNLVMDFDFIAQGVANRSPKYMEWYSAFGLIVTLIWLYLEILRLLAKRK